MTVIIGIFLEQKEKFIIPQIVILVICLPGFDKYHNLYMFEIDSYFFKQV